MCWSCGGDGHPARLCPSVDVNHFEDGDGCNDADGGACYQEDDWQDSNERIDMFNLEEWKEVKQRNGKTVASPPGIDAWHVRQCTATKRSMTTVTNQFELLALDEHKDDDNEIIEFGDNDDGIKEGWMKLTAVVDSGSVECVMPNSAVPFVAKRPSTGSIQGKKYRGAGGEPIPNQGEKTIEATTAEGQKKRMVWQIALVKRPLVATSRLNESGHTVVISKRNPRIVHEKTGMITRLRKEGGVHVVDLWIKMPGDLAPQKVFSRQAK